MALSCLLLLLASFSFASTTDMRDLLDVRSLQEESKLETQAKAFDRYLNGRMSKQEEKDFRAECGRIPDANVFCLSFRLGPKFDRRVRNRLRRPKDVRRKRVAATQIVITKKGRIANWRKVRKASIKSLMMGVSGWTLTDLKNLKKVVLAEPGCPNALAITIGALFEDYFPAQVTAQEIAEVYEKGASCLKDSPPDQEHFYTRVGLLFYWQKDFEASIRYLEKNLQIADAYLPRALYWLYRAYDQLGQKDKSVTYFERLIKDYPISFHAAVAALSSQRDLGGMIQNDSTLFPTLVRSTKVTLMNPLIEVAEVMRKFGFEGSSSFIADWALETSPRAESEVKNYLMDMASAPKKITLALDYVNRPRPLLHRKILEWYFPAAFSSAYERQSAQIDPYLLMAVTRQESTFNEKAISLANAQGLMQVQPETAYILSKGKRVDLLEPDTNVHLGSMYLQLLLKKHDHKAYHVLAAYNAGEDKLLKWMRRYPSNDPILFIDLISYRETRNYVAAVLRNYYWYRRLYGKNAEGLADLIEPKVIRSE